MRALDLDATSFQNLIAKEKKKNWEDGYKHINALRLKRHF